MGSAIQQELAAAHDHALIGPDIEFAADHVDVSRAAPLRAGIAAIRVAKSDMHARDFFILQDVADYVTHSNIGADGELAHAVAVLVSVRVAPEFVFERAIGAVRFRKPIALNADGERLALKVAVLGAEIIADHAIDHEGSVYFAGGGKDFSARQVAPGILTDDAAGLEPLVIGVHLGGNVRPGRRRGADRRRGSGDFNHQQADAIHLAEVRAHAVAHDLLGDVDHVGMTDLAPGYDLGHLHTGAQLVELGLGREDTDLACLQVVEDRSRHIGKRTRRDMFKRPAAIRRAQTVELSGQGGRNFDGGQIGDQRYFFERLNPQAHARRVARSLNEGGLYLHFV